MMTLAVRSMCLFEESHSYLTTNGLCFLTSQEVETIYGLYEDDMERDKRLRMHNQTAKRVKLFLQKNGLDFGWSDKTIKTFVSASKDNPLYFNHETGNIEGFIAPDNSALLNEYEIIDIE